MTAQPENSIRESLAKPTPIVPAFLPPIEPMPEAAKPIPFWTAFFFYPFRRKWGPHLAAGPMKSAVAAHFLAVFMTIVFGLTTYLVVNADPPSLPGMRLRLGMLVRQGIVASSRTESPGMIAWLIVVSPLALTLMLLVVALMTAPAAESGDGMKSACRRSINDVLWMTTILPWIGGLALVFYSLQRLINARIAHTGILSLMELMIHNSTIAAILCVVALVFIVRIWRAGVASYVGPASGPGFQPRRPRCEDCGYLIGGLPTESNCPECGLAVLDSLPSGRRAELTQLDERVSFRSPAEYVRFWKWMLTDRTSMKRLPMFDVDVARRFWWIGYFYGFGASLLVLVPMRIVAEALNDPSAIVMTAAAMVMISAAPALQFALGVVAIIIGRLRYGIEDSRVCRNVSEYASVMLGAFVPLIILQTLIVFTRPLRSARFEVLGVSIDAITIPSTVLGVVAIYVAIEWGRRCVSGLRDAAFANS